MIKNILAIRNDRFGEFLLNVPALRALKETYPAAKLTLAVSLDVYDLAKWIEYADRVVIWDDNFRKNLRGQRFDVCIVFNPTKEAHWAVFWAGIPARVGYNRKWGFLLRHKLKDTKHLGDRHEVDCNLELVGLIGAKTIDKTLKIKVDDNLFREFIGQRIVAIHPFTSDPVKQWPVERFKELALRIKRELELEVVIIGLSQSVLDIGDGIISMINETSLVELAALLERCFLLISCDSGPVHLAAAVGTPVIALFRNDLVGKTAKRWGTWGEGHMVIEKSNLNDISVDDVFEKVKQRLFQPPSEDSQ